MAARVDIRVHAQRHARDHALLAGQLIEAIELAWRLDVDRLEPERDGARQLVGALADAGEHDLARLEPAAQRDVDFAHRIGVDAAAEALSSRTISSVEFAFSA